MHYRKKRIKQKISVHDMNIKTACMVNSVSFIDCTACATILVDLLYRAFKVLDKRFVFRTKLGLQILRIFCTCAITN